jgi:hypothetical protein
MLIRSALFAWLLLGLFAACAHTAGGEVLDRLAATVNGHPILLSDWDDQMRYESFMSGRELKNVTAEERKSALNHLIDQELLREQVRAADAKSIPPEQINTQLDSVKAAMLRDNPSETWQQALSKYRLSEDFVRNHIANELQQLQLIDARFRPSIQVSQIEIEQYYKDQLVPKLPAGDPVSLGEATPRIREILVQNKINQMLGSWLESLRSQAQIKSFDANSESPPGPPKAVTQ